MEYAILGGLIAGVWLLLLWLSIIVWVYRDIRDRTRDLGLQVLGGICGDDVLPGDEHPGARTLSDDAPAGDAGRGLLPLA